VLLGLLTLSLSLSLALSLVNQSVSQSVIELLLVRFHGLFALHLMFPDHHQLQTT